MPMLHESPTLVQSLDAEALAADAQRLIDLHRGAIALLVGECSPRAVKTARDTMLESTAILASVAEALVGHAARIAEGERARRAHELHQAQITAGIVTGGAR